jgi:hypothetical protein
MKRVLFIVIACCFFSVKGYSQEPTENPNAPEITFEETVHDFGTILQNGVAEFEFKFTNTGKEPLKIQSCSASCGCTTPTCPTEKSIMPGEKGTVKVRYGNTHVVAPFNKQVTVTTNAKNSVVRLTIKGEIVQNTEETTAK